MSRRNWFVFEIGKVGKDDQHCFQKLGGCWEVLCEGVDGCRVRGVSERAKLWFYEGRYKLVGKTGSEIDHLAKADHSCSE
jgi:hypothetical protein